jgi:hypothetical protein
MFNPLRYATLLYAIPIILGLNPQEIQECETAQLYFPPGTAQHIHNLCVRALFPGADDTYCERLFRQYLFGSSESNDACPRTNNKTNYIFRNDFIKGMAITSRHVISKLKDIPYEYGRIMTTKDRIAWEKTQPTFKDIFLRIKEKHPEYPSEFWIPYEEALVKEENQTRKKHSFLNDLTHKLRGNKIAK